MKVKVLSEFAKYELPYPMSEWVKGVMESGGTIQLYMGRRRTNPIYKIVNQELELDPDWLSLS